MYTTVRGVVPATATSTPASRRAAGPTVVLLGVTSLLTDVSSEMVAAILPVYLTLHLGLSPLLFGLVDGLYQGATALVRIAAGHLSDRSGRPKVVAAAGYAMSAVAKLALLPAAGVAAIAAVIAADRTGKGIRTAPRDAMIAAAAPAGSLGYAFGVHRALDTVGALTGPILAFALLAFLPGGYDSVFVVSFAFAVTGVAVLVLLVKDPTRVAPRLDLAVPVQWRDTIHLIRTPSVLRMLVAATLLALTTVSDAFLYLLLHDRTNLPPAVVPLLFVVTSGLYLVLAVPVGRLADRVGRLRVFVGGHVALLCCYAVVLGPGSGVAVVLGSLGLLGVYYAATDGVLSALASGMVPDHLRSSGLALAQTAVALGKLASAVAFGALWTVSGPGVALWSFAGGLCVAILGAAVLLSGVFRTPKPST